MGCEGDLAVFCEVMDGEEVLFHWCMYRWDLYVVTLGLERHLSGVFYGVYFAGCGLC